MCKQFLDNSWIRVHEGYLKKSPPTNSKSIFNLIAKFNCSTRDDNTRRRWRKRYFVLTKSRSQNPEFKLLYFRSKSSMEDTKSLGCVDIMQMVTMHVDVDYKTSRPNTFSIATKDHKLRDRVYYLSAESNDAMLNWAQHIKVAVEMNDLPDSLANATIPKYHKPTSAQSKLNQLTRSSSSSVARTTSHLPMMSSPNQKTFCSNTIGRRSIDNGTNSYYNLNPNCSYHSSTSGTNLQPKCSTSSDTRPVNDLLTIPAPQDEFEENLQEPFCIVDDVYRLPTDMENSPSATAGNGLGHAYINLNENGGGGQPNSDIYFNQASISNKAVSSSDPNYFFPSPCMNERQDNQSQSHEYNNMAAIQNKEYQNFSCLERTPVPAPFESQRDNLDDDFNFPLPTRIRKSSGESTSTSCSSDESQDSLSSSDVYNLVPAALSDEGRPDLPPRKSPPPAVPTNMNGDNINIEYDDIQDLEMKTTSTNEPAQIVPPQVPRRVPLNTCSPSRHCAGITRFSSSAAPPHQNMASIPPTKPPKSSSLLINTRMSNHDNNNNNNDTYNNDFSLNYIENTCLSFNTANDGDNTNDVNSNSAFESGLPTTNHTPSPTSTSLVFMPFSSASTPIDDKPSRTEFSGASNNNHASVEYKEINVTGTEAFQKLKNRIQNK